MDYETLKTIIANGEFEKLIGEIENDFFDCKRSPYRFDNEKGKHELAKDVSSFANAKGGFILVGIETEKNSTHLGDEVKRIRPYEENLINYQQYRDIIKEWVFPNPQDISFQWFKDKTNSGKGICVISIPEQPSSLRPFLVTKTVVDEKRTDILFGYFERKLDNSQHSTVTELQRLLHTGLFYEENIDQRLKNIEVSVIQGIRINNVIANMEQEVSKRVDNTLEYRGLLEKRTIILSAFTSERSELKTIFDPVEDRNSIRCKLAFPPNSRYGGWNLETRNIPKIIEGKFIRTASGNLKVADLYRDGTLIFVGLADENFLSWGPNYGDQLKFNPLALVEIIYSFVSFYCKIVLNDFESKPSRFSIRLDLRHMHLDAVKSKLGPYGLNTPSQRFNLDTSEAPSDNFSITKEFLSSNCDPSTVSFALLKEIYLWFGIEENKIPYTKLENGVRMVDPEAIINPNK